MKKRAVSVIHRKSFPNVFLETFHRPKQDKNFMTATSEQTENLAKLFTKKEGLLEKLWET